MENKKSLRKLSYGIVIFFIMLLIIYKIGSRNAVNYSIMNLLLMFIIMIAYIIFKILRPNWLLSTGKYNEAINGFEKISEKYSNKIRVKNAALFNIALCYSRMGDFEKSDEYLKQIDMMIVRF